MMGRSNDLQGLRLDVYRFISFNPHCTREDVAKGLELKSSTATARIKELIDAGYVFEPQGVRKTSSYGVRSRVLQVTDRPMSGVKNDRVAVEVTLTIDCNGVYGATARVVNGKPQSGRTRPLSAKRLTLLAPPPAVIAAQADHSEVVRESAIDLQLSGDQIIDGDYKIVEVE